MKFFKALIVVLILLSFGLFVNSTDLHKVQDSLHAVGFKFFVLIATTFIAYYLGTVGWRYCMAPPANKLNLLNLFKVRHIGEMVGIVNPTSIVGGEAVKLYLLSRSYVQRNNIIVSLLLSRLLMVVTQLILFFTAFGLLLFYHVNFRFMVPSVPWWLAILLAGITILTFTLSFNRRFILETLKARYNRVFRYIRRVHIKSIRVARAFKSFFTKHPKAVFASSLFFIFHWIFGSLEFYFILKFLGVHATVIQALLVDMGVIFFKAAGAFVPAQIGVEEYGNKIMLQAIGLPDVDIWITASLLRRARQLFWIGIGLLIYFVMYRKKQLPQLQN